MKLYKLNKSVLSIKNNADKFLGGCTSNTLDKPQNAFLNIHGRIIATFNQIKVNEDECLIVVEASVVDMLLEYMDRYIKLSKIEVKKLNKYVYFDLDNELRQVPDACMVLSQRAGRLIVSDDELKTAVSDEAFMLFRLRHSIAMHGIDYVNEFVLNVSETDFVSFTKGCFLGQEPVAKVHNRSRPTWKLVIKYEDECTQEEKSKMTSKVLDPNLNRKIGFVFIRDK